MIEIEYNLTLEDEINNIETTNEYVAKSPLLHWQNDYLVPIMFLGLNIPYLWQYFTSGIPFYPDFQGLSVVGIILNFVFAGLSMPQISRKLPINNWLPKYKIERDWRKNPNLNKPRKIIITDKEFILEKSENYLFLEERKEISYLWEELKRYLISDRGIILEFNRGELYFIPQRIFTSRLQFDEFRELLNRRKQ